MTAETEQSATHARLDAKDLRASDTYRLMTDIVAPRPIAWVSTVAPDGTRNLAPFSYFQAVCSNPATIVLGISWKSDGTPKDTLANILATREFTVCHVDEAQAAAMHRTSANVGPEVDEWELAGVEATASNHVAPPRIRSAAAALECRLGHAIPIGQGPTGKPSSTLVVAEVLSFVVRSALVRRDEQGRLRPIDPDALQGVGRLGGIAYTKTGDRFDFDRPRTSIGES